uniref:Nose resistant-to-fluoxetine protein N-terminal domain-containing protein n=1 Tax=Timema shepardi TaxID=629360 RepID=A0A7R9AYG0_TIMSH|nr:unnamed protein product [Timema shepardi]
MASLVLTDSSQLTALKSYQTKLCISTPIHMICKNMCLAAVTSDSQNLAEDATGRYTTGFFFGNNFWLGSASLCESLGVRDPRNTSLPSPFLLGFYKLRVELGLVAEISPNIRNLHIGLCLPYSCNSEDAQLLLELSSLVGNELRTVAVSNVRSPHHSFNMWEDTTFWILVGFSSFIAVMLVIGTGYDLYLEHKSTHSFSNNISYEIARIGQPAINKAECLDPAKGLTVTTNNNNISNEMKESNGNIAIYNRSICNEVLPPQNIEDTPQLSIWSEVVLSFSVRLNLKTICDQTVGEDTIPTIHGLRSISMAWVILGHTCIVAFKYSDNMEYRGLVEKEFLFQTISNGAFSVDTFFFISGVLVSFLYFRTVAKIDVTKLTMSTGVLSNFMQFLGLLGYRFLRLTVPYMFVLGVAEVSMKWFYFNSVFEPPTLDHINCPNYWWRNLLYINTLFPVEDMCMVWSWYLANDTQFFILGAVLLILAVSMDPLALFDKIYDKPWTRLGPYLIGMSVGWILYKTNCKITMNKLVVTIGWLTSTSLFLLLIYGLYDAHLHPITAAAYSSLSHSAWALSLSWIVVACSTGYGGYVDKLLSLSILYPFSRVTYCAYLVHPIVIRVMAMKMDSPLHLSKDIVMILFLGQAVASYILAFVVSITYEAPIVSLLKICSPKKKKRSYPVAQ